MGVGTKIFVYKLEESLTEEERGNLSQSLSADEKEKVSRFKFKKDADISLVSRFLLRQILGSFLSVPAQEIIFSYNQYDRPYLEGGVDFNVSHAGNRIVIAVNPKGKVGVDIEKIKPIEDNVANICFTSEEKEYINQENGFDLERFFELWTLKEAFIKAHGQGMSYPLLAFYFQIDNEISFFSKEKSDKWNFKRYEIDPEYKLALCLDSKDFPERIDIISDWKNYL